MPKAVKQKQQSEELPNEYTQESLEALKRPQIQALAKREGLKANMSTRNIIAALLRLVKAEKVVEGLLLEGTADEPAAVDRNSTQEVTSAPKPQIAVSRNESSIMASEEVQQRSSGTPKKSALPPARSPPSSERRPTPYPLGRPATPSRSKSPRPPAGMAIPASVRAAIAPGPPIYPTDKDIRDIRRRLTVLNNERVSLQAQVKEMQKLLSFSKSTLPKGENLLKEVAFRREALENGFISKMSEARYLWDGTGNMSRADQRKWRRFVDEHWGNTVSSDSEEEDGASVHGHTDSDSSSQDEMMSPVEVGRTLVEDDDYDGDGDMYL